MRTHKAFSVITVSLVVATGALASTALATPKTMPDYSKIGVGIGKPGGSYTLVLGDSPQSFMYYGAIDSNAQSVTGQMFDGLIEYNLASYKIEPALAESWTASSDGKVWTFKLRPNLVWSDGAPLSAEDVVFSFRRLIDPSTAAQYAQLFYIIENSRQANTRALPPDRIGVSAPAKDTVVLRLSTKKPEPPRAM